jgi:glycosyltransferase involved in cell wall biosynthesis
LAALVSVVVPARDAAAFLSTAIDSVLAQTYADLELLVVDDGSTDGTADVVRGYSDDRVRLLSGAGEGPGAARNIALEAGRGEYVAFLDADDYWLPAKLERQVRVLEADGSVAAVGTFMRYEALTTGRQVGVTGTAVGPEEQRRLQAGHNLPFPLSSLVTRKVLLEEVGGLDEGLAVAGDLDLMARLARSGTFVSVEEVLGVYRVHRASISHRQYGEQIRAAAFIAARLEARDGGWELSFDEFARGYRTSWNQRRRLAGQRLYRSAGVTYAEGEPLRAAWLFARSALLNPRYSIPRLLRQGRSISRG